MLNNISLPTSQIRVYKKDLERLAFLVKRHQQVFNQRFTQADVINILLDKAFEKGLNEHTNETN